MLRVLPAQVDGWETWDGVRGVNVRGETSEALNSVVALNSANADWISRTLPDE